MCEFHAVHGRVGSFSRIRGYCAGAKYVYPPHLRYHSPVPDDPQKNNPWIQLARYSQLAVVFPAATVVGWLIGAGLDRWLHTTWLYIVGLILGSIAGFVELIRAASKDSNAG